MAAEDAQPKERPSPQSGSGPTETFMRVVTYVDSPFKLLVVITLGLLAYGGYFFHTNYQTIFAVYQKQRELPSMNAARFDEVAALTMREARADVVVIFTVDPILNRRTSVRVYQKEGGREARVEGVEVGLFTSNEDNNRDVIELLAGRIPCGEYRRPQSELGLWYLTKGVTFTCRVSVPPEINQFIGQITVGWRERPEDIEYARDILTVAARALTVRR